MRYAASHIFNHHQPFGIEWEKSKINKFESAGSSEWSDDRCVGTSRSIKHRVKCIKCAENLKFIINKKFFSVEQIFPVVWVFKIKTTINVFPEKQLWRWKSIWVAVNTSLSDFSRVETKLTFSITYHSLNQLLVGAWNDYKLLFGIE